MFDNPNVTELKGKYEEAFLAFENEDSMKRFQHAVTKKNSRHHKMEELKVEGDEGVEIAEKKDQKFNLDKILAKVQIHYEGLTVDLMDESNQKTNQLVLNSLSIEVF